MGSSLLPFSAIRASLFFISKSICFDLTVEQQMGTTRHYKFEIQLHNVTRLCHSKLMLTVNGNFSGPRVKECQLSQAWRLANLERVGRWTGICNPMLVQSGQSCVYNFTIIGQKGTLFWHAHISWLRATLYGPIIILPKKTALRTGAGPNVPNAYTINGFPGPLYNCSANLLRITQSPLVRSKQFTLSHLKPIYLLIMPGQSTYVLLTTKPNPLNTTFLMAAMPNFFDQGTLLTLMLLGIHEFEKISAKDSSKISIMGLQLLTLPPTNATFVANFNALEAIHTPKTKLVKGLMARHLQLPLTMSLSHSLEYHFFKPTSMDNQMVYNIYTTDFLSFPITPFNYTGKPPNNTKVANGTKVVVLPLPVWN
ncbi:laccase diphenol oxidase family [Olea europaea subsp. europaea]|uniref:Laccase diphenol oxidase family n=1 Tax=Olea europaea subsp. europaea TaxID=158383 RepID=A0A8S0SKY9_OLEEU|nr:laccase diphenol oxidase family [Olea europaea subsp. europaea]